MHPKWDGAGQKVEQVMQQSTGYASSFPAFIQRVKDGHAGVPQLPDFLMHKLQPFILLLDPYFLLLCISKTVSVIVQQLAPNRESIKLLDPAGRLADTPSEKHIEFQPALAAEPNQRRDIQRFEKSHHGIRRVHP